MKDNILGLVLHFRNQNHYSKMLSAIILSWASSILPSWKLSCLGYKIETTYLENEVVLFYRRVYLDNCCG